MFSKRLDLIYSLPLSDYKNIKLIEENAAHVFPRTFKISWHGPTRSWFTIGLFPFTINKTAIPLSWYSSQIACCFFVFFFWGGRFGRRHKTILRPDRKFNATGCVKCKDSPWRPNCHARTRQHDRYIWITNLSDRHRTSRATERHILGHFNGFFYGRDNINPRVRTFLSIRNSQNYRPHKHKHKHWLTFHKGFFNLIGSLRDAVINANE